MGGNASGMPARKLAWALIAGGLCVSPVRATVLTFDTALPNGSAVPPGYGQRVTATSQDGFFYGAAGGFTPNVTVSYGPVASDVHLWNLDYGDLQQVIYRETEGAGILEVTLAADPGYQVILQSFDLAGWPNADYIINSVQVIDAFEAVVFARSEVLIEGDFNGPRRTQFDFGAGLMSSALTVRFDSSNLGGSSDNIGLDNLQFSQVPEPATWILLGGGLAACVRRRGRAR